MTTSTKQYAISRNSWHFRLYSYYLRELCSRSQEPEVVNLCPYVRSILLWLPLRFFFLRVSVGLAFVFIFSLLGIDIGFFNMFKILLGCAVGAAALGGLIFGGLKLHLRWELRRLNARPSEPKTILGQWVKANHDKICPRFAIED